MNEQQNLENWFDEDWKKEELEYEQKVRERRALRVERMKKEKARCIMIQNCIKIGVPVVALVLVAIVIVIGIGKKTGENDNGVMKQEDTIQVADGSSNEKNPTVQGNTENEVASQNSVGEQSNIASQSSEGRENNAASQSNASGQGNAASQNSANGQDNAASQNSAGGQSNTASQNNASGQGNAASQNNASGQGNAASQNNISGQDNTTSQSNNGDSNILSTHNNQKGQNYLNSLPHYSATTTSDTLVLSSEIISTNALLIDLESDTILAQKNMKEVLSPASMTKVLTVLVAAEQIEKSQLDDTFTMTLEITDYAYVNDCSSVGFLDGEVITVRDLFYGTILPSGGDAAVGLATYVAGSHEAFVELMNEKLEELGLADTAHFTNCVGLYDKEHHCTVYDMAMIMEAAIENEICREVMNARTYTTSATPEHPEGITISNWFLRRIEDKDTGGEVLCAKTGFVNQSGSCAVSYAKDNGGKEYVCVTTNATSSWKCIYDHVAIYKMFATGE